MVATGKRLSNLRLLKEQVKKYTPEQKRQLLLQAKNEEYPDRFLARHGLDIRHFTSGLKNKGNIIENFEVVRNELAKSGMNIEKLGIDRTIKVLEEALRNGTGFADIVRTAKESNVPIYKLIYSCPVEKRPELLSKIAKTYNPREILKFTINHKILNIEEIKTLLLNAGFTKYNLLTEMLSTITNEEKYTKINKLLAAQKSANQKLIDSIKDPEKRKKAKEQLNERINKRFGVDYDFLRYSSEQEKACEILRQFGVEAKDIFKVLDKSYSFDKNYWKYEDSKKIKELVISEELGNISELPGLIKELQKNSFSDDIIAKYTAHILEISKSVKYSQIIKTLTVLEKSGIDIEGAISAFKSFNYENKELIRPITDYLKSTKRNFMEIAEILDSKVYKDYSKMEKAIFITDYLFSEVHSNQDRVDITRYLLKVLDEKSVKKILLSNHLDLGYMKEASKALPKKGVWPFRKIKP